jgi:hypothetical protein
MSDADKPTPENAPVAKPEARHDARPELKVELKAEPGGGLGGNVISINTARAELLRRPRARSGVVDLSRARGREVPSPVTMPPGQHSAVIVTDSPAARAHFDKRTVHPGEAPERVHDKKVRVKTSLDPRRAKTHMTDRRGELDDPMLDDQEADGGVESLWNPASNPPPPNMEVRPSGYARTSASPPGLRNQKKGSPLFLVGVALSAALGAVLVFMLSRHKTEPTVPPAPSEIGVTAPSARVALPAQSSASAAASHDGPAQAGPSSSSAPASNGIPGTAKTARPLASTKPSASASASAAPTATAKPTATSILPFGKEEP